MAELGYARVSSQRRRLLAELARARELALARGQSSAGVQAEYYRGKAAGLYEDRLSLTASISDTELLKAIEELLGTETAEVISAALGLRVGLVLGWLGKGDSCSSRVWCG